MPLTAEIFAVGDELCYGRVRDTNSFWLADQLTQRGVMVQRITCIRDDKNEISEGLKDSLHRSPSFILITGGLGPTEDDVTLSALAEISGKTIVASKLVLEVMSKRRNVTEKDFSPLQIKMSSTLEGAECVPNPVGWAPVTILKLVNSIIMSLPGPPKEMQACFNQNLAGYIESATGFRSCGRRVWVTMYESQLAPLISEIAKTLEGVYLKSLVAESTREQGMPVEILAFDHSDESCNRKCQAVVDRLREMVSQKGGRLREV